ncbi:MAG: LEA type 2 family protein [Kofleriaceae bacterium]
MIRRGVFAIVCLLAVAFAGLGAGGCAANKAPELRVLGVQEARRHDVVFVQVTNPASRPMRLTKLAYTFAAQGATVSKGEVDLSREVPPNAAVVVEVPLDAPPTKSLTLSGKLTAELDQIVRSFTVSAQVHDQ